MCASILTADTSKITKATSNLTVPFGSVKFDVKLRHYTTFYVNSQQKCKKTEQEIGGRFLQKDENTPDFREIGVPALKIGSDF